MAIFKKHIKASFTVVANDFLRNPAISLKAKAVYAILIGMPETWRPSSRGLEQVCSEGRHSIRAAMRELKELGYLELMHEHDEAGRIVGSEWHLYDEPNVGNTESQKTRHSVNLTLLKDSTLENKDLRKEREPLPKEDQEQSQQAKHNQHHVKQSLTMDQALGDMEDEPSPEPIEVHKEPAKLGLNGMDLLNVSGRFRRGRLSDRAGDAATLQAYIDMHGAEKVLEIAGKAFSEHSGPVYVSQFSDVMAKETQQSPSGSYDDMPVLA